MSTHEPRTNERTPAGPGHDASRTVAGAGDISEWSQHDLCELVASLQAEISKKQHIIDLLSNETNRLWSLLNRIERKATHGCFDATCEECDRE